METKYKETIATDLTYKQVGEKAIEVSYEYSFNYEKDYLIDLAESIGGKVIILKEYNSNQLEDCSIVVNGSNDFIIYLSIFDGVFKSRFLIAIELGHYFLHSGDPSGSKQIKSGRYYSNKAKWQAIHFASVLLMPKKQFKIVAKRTSNNIKILSGHFRVPESDVEIRLKRLHLGTINGN